MKYTKSDDGKSIQGAQVVWLELPVADADDAPPSRDSVKAKVAREALAAAAARTLEAAAKDGVPFCEECQEAEAARA